jgi:Zn-dependent protease
MLLHFAKGLRVKWSFKIAQVAGIGIYVHATFFLILVWVVITHGQGGISEVASGLLFTLAVFGCVVLHELGHALMAKRYGIRTRDITLLPIGGVARLERMPDEPIQEFWVALAGPAVNVAIAAIMVGWLSLTRSLSIPEKFDVVATPLALKMLIVNVFLVVFNLLPAFPMDGGRVLRALLATRMDYVQATQIAAGIGQGMAVLFLFLGLFSGNPMLMFIAFFVWVGAAQEASMAQMKSALGGIPVMRAMLTNFETLSPHDTLSHAVERTLAGSQRDFPVVEGDRLVGVLLQEDLLAALAAGNPQATVASAMRDGLPPIEAGEMLESVLPRLQSQGASSVPVLFRGRLAGLLTLENIGELLSIQAALGAAARKR